MSHSPSHSILTYVDYNEMSSIVRLTTGIAPNPSIYIISPQGFGQTN